MVVAFASSGRSFCRFPASSSPFTPRFPLSPVPPLCARFVGLNSHQFSAFAFKTGCIQARPLLRLLRSKFIGQSLTKSLQTVAMEGHTSSTVPSIVVYVTVPNREAGKKLAESIIKEKLAACVNVVPGIESIYFWDGKIQTDSEELLIIKTRESLLEALTEHVKANHEYEVPEVISMPITGGNLKYLEWLKNSTRDE